MELVLNCLSLTVQLTAPHTEHLAALKFCVFANVTYLDFGPITAELPVADQNQKPASNITNFTGISLKGNFANFLLPSYGSALGKTCILMALNLMYPGCSYYRVCSLCQPAKEFTDRSRETFEHWECVEKFNTIPIHVLSKQHL